MKFRIERTSDMGGGKKPCKEAKSTEATSLDVRNVSTIEEAKKKSWFQNWWDGGTNHREEIGDIVCESKTKHTVWYIEINSLEELLAIIQQFGNIIICCETNYKEFEYFIEIYDDYRE